MKSNSHAEAIGWILKKNSSFFTQLICAINYVLLFFIDCMVENESKEKKMWFGGVKMWLFIFLLLLGEIVWEKLKDFKLLYRISRAVFNFILDVIAHRKSFNKLQFTYCHFTPLLLSTHMPLRDQKVSICELSLVFMIIVILKAICELALEPHFNQNYCFKFFIKIILSIYLFPH